MRVENTKRTDERNETIRRELVDSGWISFCWLEQQGAQELGQTLRESGFSIAQSCPASSGPGRVGQETDAALRL